MAYRAFLALAVFWLIMGHIKGQAYPCFAAERVSRYERRFFAFVPSNVFSEPPIECTFVFGGPPGSRLRMAAYDVQTKDDKVGGEGECRRNSLRVYDVGIQGIQLMATYCGILRRGQMLTMSSNTAVVTFTSDNNSLNNAFNLVVDAVERNIRQPIPCSNPVTETNQETTFSQENITLSATISTELSESLSTTEFSDNNHPTSENEEKESITPTSAEEENQSSEASTEMIDRDYNATEAEARESQETAFEAITTEDTDENESQL